MIERRRHPRMVAKGAVLVHVADTSQKGRIVDVAEGGILIATSVTPPARWLGRGLEVEMRLDGLGDWLRGTARVVRIVASGLAISFTTAPVALGRILTELGGAAHARRRSLAVVLVDAEAERRASMVRAFRSVGCAVVEARTPLEAVFHLGESSFEPDVIAIADSHPMDGADALRRFAALNHPRASLVRILSGDGPAEGPGGWVSATDSEQDLPRRVRDVLLQVLAT